MWTNATSASTIPDDDTHKHDKTPDDEFSGIGWVAGRISQGLECLDDDSVSYMMIFSHAGS